VTEPNPLNHLDDDKTSLKLSDGTDGQPYLIHGSMAHTSLSLKHHLDQFSHFCKAHWGVQHNDRQITEHATAVKTDCTYAMPRTRCGLKILTGTLKSLENTSVPGSAEERYAKFK